MSPEQLRDQRIERAVAGAPPLPPEVLAELRWLLPPAKPPAPAAELLPLEVTA